MSMDVGARIKAWREAKGWSQQELADAVGVTHAAVYQWEDTGENKTTPSLAKLEKVAEAIGITMERFYGRIPKTLAKAS
jgi:transcriptional regulator with XRE-family HTH domain